MMRYLPEVQDETAASLHKDFVSDPIKYFNLIEKQNPMVMKYIRGCLSNFAKFGDNAVGLALSSMVCLYALLERQAEADAMKGQLPDYRNGTEEGE